MEDLSVNDLSLLIKLVDESAGRGLEINPRLTYIRFCLVEQAILVNGGVDS